MQNNDKMIVYYALICPATMQVVINNSGLVAGCSKVFDVPTDSAIEYVWGHYCAFLCPACQGQ